MHATHKRKLVELILSFHPVGLGDQTQIVSFSREYLYSLNHLSGPLFDSFFLIEVIHISYKVVTQCLYFCNWLFHLTVSPKVGLYCIMCQEFLLRLNTLPLDVSSTPIHTSITIKFLFIFFCCCK